MSKKQKAETVAQKSPKRKPPPSIKRIVEWACKNIDECGLACDLGDYPTAPSLKRRPCWRCGLKKAVERCHIIPHSLGGSNHPSNYVLLCKICHTQAPDLNDKEFMFKWIAKTKRCWLTTPMKLYKEWTGVDFQTEIEKIGLAANNNDEVLKVFKHIFKNIAKNKTSYHPGGIPDQTTNYAVMKTMEKLKIKYNVK